MSFKKEDIIIILALFVLASGIRLYDLNGAGGTFDEYNYFRMSINHYQAFQELNFSKEKWYFFKEHPPIGRYVLTIFNLPTLTKSQKEVQDSLITGTTEVENLLPGQIYKKARIASVLYGGLTIVLVYLFCMKFLSRKTGIIAGILLALLPNFIPYHKIATLDAPTSFFFTLGAWIFALALQYNTWKWWIILGITSGLAIATKFNLGLLFIFYCIIYLLWKRAEITSYLKQAIKQKNIQSAKKLFTKLWYWKLFFVPVIALLILYIVWPWLWPAPIERMMISIRHWEGGPGIEPWFGSMKDHGSNWLYYLVYFVFTTPVLILLLFLISLHYNWKNKTFWNMFVLLWFATPFLWSFSPQKTDGMRYLTMIYPPLAILAAQGLQHALRTPKKLFIGIAILLVYLIAIDAWIHPYYLDYYNILIGGPKNVQEKNLLEFNWFGEGKKELVEWINKNTLPQAVVATKWNPSHDLVGWRNDIIELPLLESEFVGNPEYLAINHRYIQYDASKDKHALNMANYTLIKEIKAGGGTLGQVYKEKNEGKRTPQTVAIKVCDTRSGQCQNLRQKELSQALARTETKDYKYLNFTLLIGRIISQSS